MRNETAFYYDAYNTEYVSLWNGTPFSKEIGDLCFARASSCWLRDNDLGEEDRRKLLYSYLSAQWSTDNTNDQLNLLYPNLPTDNLVVKRIVKNIGYAYNEPPTREFTIKGNEWQHSQEIKDILKEMDLDSYMRQAYQLSILTNEVALRPMLIEGKWRIDLLTPDLYRVQRDSLGNPILMWIPFQTTENGETVQKYKVWAPTTYEELDYNFKRTPISYNGKEYSVLGNPYKSIPYVFLKLNKDPDKYGGGEWEIAKSQLTCNMIDFLRDENLVYGTMGLWFFKNTGLSAEEIKFNPGRIFIKNDITEMDIEPTIEYIDASQLWSELEEVKDQIVARTLKNLGMPASMLTDNPGLQSGVSMKLDRMELEERRQTDLQVLQSFEQDFLKMLLRVYNAELKKGYETPELSIDYVDSKIYEEPQQELEYLTNLLDKGLITLQNYVVKITGNTNIKTDEEAIEFINQNIGAVNEIRTGATGGKSEPISNANAA